MKLEKVTIAVLMVLLTLAIFPSQAAQGPREEDLQMFFYSDVLASYAALEAGEVDIVGFDIQESIYIDAKDNPNVAMAPVDDMGMYEFDLNNNYTIASYPGVRSPTNYVGFRQALARLVDKDLIVDTYCGGFAARIDQPIAPPASGWMNSTYTGGGYPYPYNPAAASTTLDAAGFTNETSAGVNPWYDDSFPGSTTTLRVYPPGHSKAGLVLDPVKVYVRTDDPRRFQAGRHLYENARKVGIPIEPLEGPSSYTYDPVMGLFDYHVYTGGWSLGRFPTSVYFFFHTDYFVSYGSNYVCGFEADGSPNHPVLNTLLYNVYYADTFIQAQAATKLAMGLFVELCVNIPLFGARAFWVYSTELLGTVNMDSYAYDQDLFFKNAYKASGDPIKWAVITPPNALNALYSSWTYDYQCLDKVYLYAGFDLPPYNIVADQPGYVLDWFADTWDDNGTIKAKNYKRFRPDNYFVDTAGNQMANVDADDYLFSCFVQYAIGVDGWNWDTVQDVKYFNKVNSTFVEIFFDARSYWLYTAAAPYLLPREIWLNTTYGLTENLVDIFVEGVNITSGDPMGLGGAQPNGPCWINSITGSVSGLLIEGTDFHWELGDWVMDSALSSGETVTVDYYAVDDASGYTLGDNNWEDVTIGCGMYYATGFTPSVGGFFTAKRNPFFYFETPVLGEVDFVWESGGYYEVTIFDVVKAATAYDSQGTGVPDDNWFPGADLAPPGGQIDIFDIVTIAAKYGFTSGQVP